MIREQLITLITTDASYKKTCRRINSSMSDDLFQEMCLLVLTIDEDKLPPVDRFNFWFYRIASNMSNPTGQIGKLLNKKEKLLPEFGQNEVQTELLIREAEKFMIELTEFENRIVLLYNQYGNMSEVQRQTGISYSALRFVKEKIKQKANENIAINAAT
jgi:hypothetical protein